MLYAGPSRRLHGTGVTELGKTVACTELGKWKQTRTGRREVVYSRNLGVLGQAAVIWTVGEAMLMTMMM